MSRIRSLATMLAVLCAFGVARATVVPASTGQRSAITAAIDAYLGPLIADRQLSGSLLVARGPEILYETAFGCASCEFGVMNDAETVFAIASITKPMTRAILDQLVTAQQLRLDDPVSRWIADFPSAGTMTVRHLAEHRSGVPHRVTSAEEETVHLTAEEMVDLARRKPLTFEPGTKASYSSAGYSVLARILELASGRSYGQLIHERIFKPSGMMHSLHIEDGRIVSRLADSYFPGWDGLRRAPLKDLSFLVGAGSVYSTPRDLLKFVEASRSGKLGDEIRRLISADAVTWRGSTNGYRSFILSRADTGLTFIFTGNLTTGAVSLLERDLPRLGSGEIVASPQTIPKAIASVSQEVLRRYEGAYSQDGTELEAVAEPPVLVVGGWALVPTSDSTFFSLPDYAAVRAVTNTQGEVVSLEWTVRGRSSETPKVR